MIVNSVAYRQGYKLRDIATDEISEFLGQPDCFVWVALSEPDAQEIERMQSIFDLHDLAVEDTLHGHQRPKIEEYGDSLFTFMRTLSVQESEVTHGEMAVFAGPNYILSVRSQSQQSFLNVRARCEREPHLLKLGPSFVLYALMDAIVDRYFPVVQALEAELETIEDQIFVKGSARANIEKLYQLKRKATKVKHAVTPLAEALVHLFGGRVPALSADTQEYYRDVYDHLHRIETAVDAMRDTIVTAIQVNLSMVAIDEGEVHKRLAAWAAIFAVATVLAGIWGMNFEHMPELDWKFGYPVALSLMGAACGGLFYRFRRAGWL